MVVWDRLLEPGVVFLVVPNRGGWHLRGFPLNPKLAQWEARVFLCVFFLLKKLFLAPTLACASCQVMSPKLWGFAVSSRGALSDGWINCFVVWWKHPHGGF
jgi:hypothetical protein